MKTVELKYNPYTVKSDISIDSKNVVDGQLYEMTTNRRLQTWIDDFLIEMFSTCNDKEVKLKFVGTDLDAGDVADAVHLFHENQSRRIQLDISGVTSISPGEKIEQLKALYEKAKKGPFDEFRDDKRMGTLFENALAPGFEVNVIATMSSGKSTFINALLGIDLMPSANAATTATIAKITDCDGMEGFTASRLNKAGEYIDQDQTADLELIKTWNTDKSTSLIEVKGDVPAIKEQPGIRLVLIDTPGPNNSQDPSHEEATYAAIKTKQPSMIIYVLNATQLGINDDKGLLSQVRDAMKSGGREAKDRFVFVVNKIDAFDPEKGESVVSALGQVRDYLKGNEINNPILIPVSAELARLIRKERFGGKLSRNENWNQKMFTELFVAEKEMDMVEHAKSSISLKNYKLLKGEIARWKEAGDEKKQAEILSGVPIVEALLDDYIAKHAIPSRLKDAVDSFKTFEANAELLSNVSKIIDSTENELKGIVKNIEKYDADQSRMNGAKKFREKLKKEKFELSEDAEKERNKIDRKLKEALRQMDDQLSATDQDDERKAKRAIDEARYTAEFTLKEIQSLLKASAENEIADRLGSIRSAYDEHAKEILNKSFPETDQNGLKDLVTRAIKLPDVETLLSHAKFAKTERVVVGTRTERHGFLWLKKRTVNVYETQTKEKYNLTEAYDEFRVGLQQEKTRLYQEQKVQLEDEFENAKNLILKEMDEIDARIAKVMNDIKSAHSNKAAREKILQENKEKQCWYESFKRELDAILAI